jgi:REP element-mobilizing transposase RayT
MMKKYNPHIHHRRSIRLKGYDYSQAGMYFVTICTQNRECLFGKITNGEMVLNDAGRMVQKWCAGLPHKFSNIELNTYVIMPNHFHGIIINAGTVGAHLRVRPYPSGEYTPMLGEHPPVLGEHTPMLDKHPPMLGEHPPMLDKHTPVSGEHTPMLGEYTPVWGEYTPMLDKHTPMLGEHTPVLGEHPPILGEHPPVLGEHPPVLGEYPPVLGEHSPVLGEYPPVLGEHPPVLGEHPPILGEHPPVLGEYPPVLGEHTGSPLHRVIQWFKTMTTNEYIRGVKTLDWNPFNKKLWQRNYYEHIIRNEQSYQTIIHYIINNPLKWAKDEFYMD